MLPCEKIATADGMPGMPRAATAVGCSLAPTVSLHPGSTAPIEDGSAGRCLVCDRLRSPKYARSCQTMMNAHPACALGAATPTPASPASTAATIAIRLMPL